MSARLCLCFVIACSSNNKDTGAPAKGEPRPEPKVEQKPEPRVAVPDAAPPPDPCSPETLGLGAVTPLAAWSPPGDCVPKGEAPRLLRSDADFRQHVQCSGGKPAIDFTKEAIVIVPRVLTPTAQDFRAYDDGKTITVVGIFRDLRPGEPRPAPEPYRIWGVVAAGADRAFADKSCKP